MPYRLSTFSERKLLGVHADLCAVVRRAITITSVDFRVIEGLRSRERQAQLVAKGASRTLNSRHITGHAVDLAPIIEGQLRWDWPLFYPIAKAMKTAAEAESVPVRWGGCWALLQSIDDPEQAVAAYVAQRREEGRSAFIDGPHFELPSNVYPGETA